jgi:hypothetical protein
MLNKTKQKLIISLVIIGLIITGGLFYYSSQPLKTDQQNIGAVNDIYIPYKIEGFKDGWITAPEYDGVDMSDNALVEAENIDFSSKTSIAPRQGSELIGTESSVISPIESMHTSISLGGRELMIRTASTSIEWWNSINSVWEAMASTTASSTASQQFSFADGNDSDETENYTYFSNGLESLKRFRVAFGTVASNDATSITLNSVSGFSDATSTGFSSPGTIRAGGVNYAYTGQSGWTLTGLSGLPTFTANGGVISAIETAGFTDAPASGSAIVIKDQRMYVAYKNSVYCSQIDDLQNFSYSATRVASEGEIVYFPDGGDKINGLGVRPDYVAVFKDNYVGSLEFQDFGADLSDIPVVKTIAKGIEVGAVSQKAISNSNFEVIYANNDIGMTTLTRLAQTDYDQTISLTEKIRPTLEGYDFSDSALIVSGNIILNSTRDNATFNNKIVVYNSLYQRLTEFQGLNANAFTVYNNDVYYGDSINWNTYKMFSSNYDDNSNPYSTSWKTKWYNFGEPTRWKELGWVFIEGFINRNTELTFNINLDEGGQLTTKAITILGTGNYVSKTSPGSSAVASGFGINPFGLVNFSEVSGSAENLLHFVGYINLREFVQYKWRNLQFSGQTSAAGSNYRIMRLIPFIHVLDEAWGRSTPNYIIN